MVILGSATVHAQSANLVGSISAAGDDKSRVAECPQVLARKKRETAERANETILEARANRLGCIFDNVDLVLTNRLRADRISEIFLAAGYKILSDERAGRNRHCQDGCSIVSSKAVGRGAQCRRVRSVSAPTRPCVSDRWRPSLSRIVVGLRSTCEACSSSTLRYACCSQLDL